MTEKELKRTKHKLTLHFVGVVFLMAFFLEILFLSFRFFNENRRDEAMFHVETQKVMQKLKQQTDILDLFNLGEDYEKIDTDYIEKRNRLERPGENMISYFIVNNHSEIVEKNIKENIDFNIFLEEYGTGVYIEEEALIRKEYINWQYEPATLYLYKRNSYSIYDYITDIITFFSLTLLLSFVFYAVGYHFVNKIMRPVEDNIHDMTDFIHNAGHELKTPLAVMHGNIQVMQAEKSFDTKLLTKSLREIDNMNHLIEGLRELSEVGKLTKKENLFLAVEVSKNLKELEAVAEKKQVSFHNQVSGSFLIRANKQEFSVLFKNLIKNAIRYNKKGGRIDINLDRNILSISDTGIGISKKDQEKIFDRFFQGDSVRSVDGFGIGLSLVKKIADANDWKIEIESKKGKGSTFRVIF